MIMQFHQYLASETFWAGFGAGVVYALVVFVCNWMQGSKRPFLG